MRDIPDYPQPGDRLQGHHAAARRRPTPSRPTVDALAAPFADDADRQGHRDRGPRASCSRRRSPTATPPGSCPCARPASCRGRSSGRSTSSSTAPTCSRSTATRSQPGEQVLIVDDVIATGGTAAATARLVERLGGEVVGFAFLLELGFLARPRPARRLPRPRGASTYELDDRRCRRAAPRHRASTRRAAAAARVGAQPRRPERRHRADRATPTRSRATRTATRCAARATPTSRTRSASR